MYLSFLNAWFNRLSAPETVKSVCWDALEAAFPSRGLLFVPMPHSILVASFFPSFSYN